MLLGDEWSLKKRVPKLAANLLAYNEDLNEHDKLVDQAVLLFNEKPKAGIKFCLANRILEQKQVAEFLHVTKGLSKFAIGEYLSDPDQTEVLLEYTS